MEAAVHGCATSTTRERGGIGWEGHETWRAQGRLNHDPVWGQPTLPLHLRVLCQRTQCRFKANPPWLDENGGVTASVQTKRGWGRVEAAAAAATEQIKSRGGAELKAGRLEKKKEGDMTPIP